MTVKEFLDQEEVRELIAEGDLATVFEKYSWERGYISELSNYLFDKGINPVDYFKESIPGGALSGLTRLTDIIIPNGITTIGDYAFYYCDRLVSVTIPESVTTINNFAFSRCSRLERIQYRSTKERWEKILKSPTWRSDSAIKIVHCIDGDILL